MTHGAWKKQRNLMTIPSHPAHSLARLTLVVVFDVFPSLVTAQQNGMFPPAELVAD